MASAFVEILADVNFVSIAITRTNNSVAAIAGKGWVTASAARREAGLSAVLQRTRRRSCRVVPQHVVLQSRRILRVGTSVSSRRAKHIWSHFIYPRKYSIQPMNRDDALTLIPPLHVAIWAQAGKQDDNAIAEFIAKSESSSVPKQPHGLPSVRRRTARGLPCRAGPRRRRAWRNLGRLDRLPGRHAS